MKKSTVILLGIILVFTISLINSDEGMYPISDIYKLNLLQKGLKIPVDQIYNPKDVSLIDAICIVGGGCTGSFISNQGLILTNHHCAFGAVQAASSKTNDYLTLGFSAKNRSEELQAKGYTIRITDSYRDVSKEVLSVVKKKMSHKDRTKAIEKKIKQIVKKTEKKHKNKRASVSEMFAGKTYVLFLYTYLKDVRMVYIPPKSIGNFGGDIDNWEWPRHTGDFSILRAYVGPDGKPAEYSKNNIPYKPKKFLKVASQGVKEDDFIFILGYPGRTYTHKTSHFLEYQQNTSMPGTIDLYDWVIKLLEEDSKKDRALAIKHSSTIKGLANVSKKNKGRLKGMKRLDMIGAKEQQEKKMQEYINSNPKLKQKYGSLLSDIKKYYDTIKKDYDKAMVLGSLRRSRVFSNAYSVFEASIERKKKDLDREYSYMNRNFKRAKQRIIRGLKNYDENTDRAILKEIFKRALKLKNKIGVIEEIVKNKKDKIKAVNHFIDQLYLNTKIHKKEFLTKLFENKIDIKKTNDSFIKLAKTFYPVFQKRKERQKELKGLMDTYSVKLLDIKRTFMGKNFIPDANGTLRLTYGHIKGYSPVDGVYSRPFTTLKGIIEKYTGKEPFDAPDDLLKLIKNHKGKGPFTYDKYKSVPVCILYDTHTTGGNSGSSVLNAKGELIGLNFDRSFEGTINDYGWHQRFSRSIGVDVRYILWTLKNYAKADDLLEEIGVSPK